MRIHSAKDVGSAVRSARKERGITQAELAGYCGCGTRFISDLENGKPTAEIGKAIDVVSMLGMDIEISARRPVPRDPAFQDASISEQVGCD